MTDPILIPNVAVFEDPHGTKYRQITSYAEVTPDLARQIVASVVPEDMHRLCLELDKAKFMARLEALEKQVEQIHAWDDAHAKEHDAGDTAMCGRVEALEQINRDNFAQLAAMREKIRADDPAVAETFDRLLPLTPKPVDAGPAEAEATRKCPACGAPVLHRYSQSMKAWLPIQYHDCKLPMPSAPPADDAAVGALASVVEGHECYNRDESLICARETLDAIRSGQVPGIYAYKTDFHNLMEVEDDPDDTDGDAAPNAKADLAGGSKP